MLPYLLFAAFLIFVAVFLALRTFALRRANRESDLLDQERDYYDRQFRRRMLTNATIGMIGVAVLAGYWVRDPLPLLFYWSGVLMMLLLLLILAATDMVSSQRHFAAMRHFFLVERAKLEAEANRLRRRTGNGKPTDDEGSQP